MRHRAPTAFPTAALALLIAGCGSATPPAATPTAPPATPTASVPPTLTATPIASTPPAVTATAAPAETAPAGAVSIEMTVLNVGPRFVPNAAAVKAGTAVFFLENVRGALPEPHNFALGTAVGQAFVYSPNVAVGQGIVFTVDGLAPGTYRFWCTVRSHDQLGMIGTLTVEP